MWPDSPYFLRRLHRRQLNVHHPVRVGLADQERFGAEDVRCGHGGNAVLQTPSAVPAVRQQERVLRLGLETRDELLLELPVHFHALPVVVEDL